MRHCLETVFGAKPNFIASALDQPAETQREVRRPIYSKAVLQVLREEAALEAKLRAQRASN